MKESPRATESLVNEQGGPESSQSAVSSSVPWYLQVATPEPPSSPYAYPLLQDDDMPDLPSDPPAILAPILSHLSTQIGLTNLSIVDLRGQTHPPPALGPSLIMIIGTARSYKHLNNSADRFCRWVRATYKLRPYADGLLGRNELKLKLRRRNRKMKLARSVGNTVAFAETGEGSPGYDDGITTGWICCNLGSVEDAVVPNSGEGAVRTSSANPASEAVEMEENEEDREALEEYQNPEDNTYIGFGNKSNAPRIVVQMFTEEKRLETDLEGLWDVRLKRKAQRAERNESRTGEQDDMLSAIAQEIEKPELREGEDESKSLGGIAAS